MRHLVDPGHTHGTMGGLAVPCPCRTRALHRGLRGLAATAAVALLAVASPPGRAASRASVARSEGDSERSGALPSAFLLLDQSRVFAYPLDELWPVALRFLRVDRGYTLEDRDKEAGFVLFAFPIGSDGAKGRGSFEFLPGTAAPGQDSVRIRVTTHEGPAHLPHALLDGLSQKVRDELGAPRPPQPTRRPGTPPPSPSPAPPAEPGPKAPEAAPPPVVLDP